MGTGTSQLTKRPGNSCPHTDRNVKYYNTTGRFLCSLCFNDAPICVDIASHTKSKKFKENESDLVKRLTERNDKAKEQLEDIEGMKLSFIQNEEVKIGEYVKCLIESLEKMEKKLKSKVIEEIPAVYQKNIVHLRELSREIEIHLNDLTQHRENPAMRIETYNTIMLRASDIFEKSEVVNEYSVPVLEFDETLTIEDIKQEKSLGWLRYTDRDSRFRTPTSIVYPTITPSNIHTNIVNENKDMTGQQEKEKEYEATVPKRIKTIELKKKVDLSSVVDSAVLSNGLIVLCERNNQRLILLNSKQEEIDEILLESKPESVAGENCHVTVLLPDENVVKTFKIHKNKFSVSSKTRELNKHKKCSGIEYIDGKLFYTAKGAIYRLNNDDTFKEFDMAFHEPKSLYKDPTDEKLVFVCCPETKSKRSTRGKVQKYRYEDNKITLTIMFPQIHRPSSVTVDNKGDIYISDSSTGTINRVTKEGNYVGPVLVENETEFLHFRFIPNEDFFVATELQSDTVTFYKIE